MWERERESECWRERVSVESECGGERVSVAERE